MSREQKIELLIDLIGELRGSAQEDVIFLIAYIVQIQEHRQDPHLIADL